MCVYEGVWVFGKHFTIFINKVKLTLNDWIELCGITSYWRIRIVGQGRIQAMTSLFPTFLPSACVLLIHGTSIVAIKITSSSPQSNWQNILCEIPKLIAYQTRNAFVCQSSGANCDQCALWPPDLFSVVFPFPNQFFAQLWNASPLCNIFKKCHLFS